MKGLLAFHGSQFTSIEFTGQLLDAKVQISMDGRGRCMDNIFNERLWRSLKYEAISVVEMTDGFNAERVIDEWMAFYNGIRPHSSLGSHTPDEVYDAGQPVGMWARRQPCPHPHRRYDDSRA